VIFAGIPVWSALIVAAALHEAPFQSPLGPAGAVLVVAGGLAGALWRERRMR
jgi:hypothetical protein